MANFDEQLSRMHYLMGYKMPVVESKSGVEHSVVAADGKRYGIIKEGTKFYVKVSDAAKENIADLWIDPHDYNEELRQAVLLLADRGMNPYIYNAQLCVLPEDVRKYAMQSISDWKDIYLPECANCSLKGQCGGFFESNRDHHSEHIKPIINDISNDI